MTSRFVKIGFMTSVVLFACMYAKAVGAKYKYAVTPNSNKYHYLSCRFARRFGTGNLKTFLSAKDALAAGHIPCKVCRPPEKD